MPLDPRLIEQLRDSAERFRKRERYALLTVETLRRLSDDEVQQAIADYVQLKREATPGTDLVKLVRSLPNGVRAVYVTRTVEMEVLNGGFNQFFWNSSGLFAADAPPAFGFFGLQEVARLVERAIEIRDSEVGWMSRFLRIRTLKSFSDSYKHTKLDLVDKDFNAVADAIEPARLGMIRARPELFTGD